jgi:hypothetical protein
MPYRSDSLNYKLDTIISLPSSTPSAAPSSPPLPTPKIQTKVLAFRRPIDAAPEIVVPAVNAQFWDKLQWFALHRPHILTMVHDRLEDVLVTLRPPPRKHKPETAMIFMLNEHMEYVTINVSDPSVLLAPAENRLGRKIHDLLPSALMDRFDRGIHCARKTGRPVTYTFPVNGVTCKGTIIAPTARTIIASVAKVLGLIAAML